MTFTPVVPMSGLNGWSYLSRTYDSQIEAFSSTSQFTREAEYFRENIGKVETAADLVADRTLMKVALGAFGLQDDIDKPAFIRKILEDGTTDEESLANRLSDKRYAALSASFGFDQADGPLSQQVGFAQTILGEYETQQFEVSVGNVNETMRFALSLERGLSSVIEGGSTDTTHWYSVMATSSLREVFETAFGLPDTFAALDIDKQKTMLQQKAEAYLGVSSVAEIAQSDVTDKLRTLFLARSEIEASGSTAQSSPLTILQGSGSAGGLLSILYSA